MKIAIVFPVINCLAYTKRAMETLRSTHELGILIVDNGSTDGTQVWVREHIATKPQYAVTLLDNGENIGLTKAWNQGIRWAREHGYDYVVLANNDVLFHPQTIDSMVAAMTDHPEWGMVTAVNERGWCMDHGGPESIFTKDLPIEPSSAESPDFSMFMLRFSTIDVVGEFDEEFSNRGKAYFEDNDYHYRMKLAGLPARCITNAPYFHYGSVTQRQEANQVVPAPQFELNRAYYMQKWGGMPGQEQYRTPQNPHIATLPH